MLAFTRCSIKRKGGVADIVEREGEEVWGVVYEIVEDRDVRTLDTKEGVNSRAYKRVERQVYQDGDDSKPLTVQTYIATKEKNPPLPHPDYKKLIVCGAEHWHLPEDYVQKLEAIKTV